MAFQYPVYAISGGNQFPAISTTAPSQYPVVTLVDGSGAVITNLGNGPADGSWITITSFLNSWGAGASPPQYMKDSRGIVHCRGLITGGSADTLAFRFPVGYRAVGTATYYFDYSAAPNGCYTWATGHVNAGYLAPSSTGPVDLSVVHFATALS